MNLKEIFLLFIMTISQLTFATPKLEQDPRLFVEKLGNNMTVVVCKNSEPPNRVSMRLLVKRGSVYETESEKGLAHFIEHMAFNGTTHFPSGDMVEYFQRLGMAFGADTNAHTGFTETVYKIDMPEVSDKLINDGLMLLRDYCDGIIFAPDAIEKERGVIIAEKNSRDTQDYRKAVKEIEHTFKGSIFANRMPIGEENVIKTAKQADFKKFYAENYRPENTVLVIVGDVNPTEVIAKAKRYFADFKASSEIARTANFGTLEQTDVKFDFNAKKIDIDAIYDSTPNAPRSYASIAVSKSGNSREDSLDKRIEYIKAKTLATAITSRFLRVADLPSSEISQGSASNFEFDTFCDTFIISTEAPVGKAFKALEECLRQLLSIENLQDFEIENAKKKIFEILESEIKSSKTRKNNALANDIVSAFSESAIFNSAENDLEIAKYALKGFDAKKAIELLKQIFDFAKIKAFVSDTKKIDDSQLAENVQLAYQNAVKSKYPADTFSNAKLIFSKFGDTGKIAERKEIDDLSITQIRFENGVRLNLKKTDFAKDEALMKISFGRGMLDIPADKPEYYNAPLALILGGTKFQNIGDINTARYLMKMSISSAINGNVFTMSARSTQKDLPNAIKLCATMFADAGFREESRPALTKQAEAFYLDYRTDPMARLRFLSVNMMDSTLSKIPGNFENFEKITMKELEEWFTPILKKSYMEISIVGDIDIEKTISLFAETFGAMPARTSENPQPYADIKLISPNKKISLTYETTDEPRSVALKIWLSAGRKHMDEMRADNVLGAVLDDVLRKDVREAQGKVYSPFAYNNSSTWINNVGFMTSATFVVPDYNAEMLTTLEKCGLKTMDNISKDEFERAKIPLIKSVEANKRRNNYWLDAVLDLSQCKPVNIELAKTIDTGYANVTLEQVRKRAKEIFSKPSYTVDVMPTILKKELKK